MTTATIAHFPQATTPKPPAGLKADGRKLWIELQRSYGIADAGGLLLLRTVCQSFDDLMAARKLVAKEGMVVTGHTGPKAHPAARLIETSHRSMMAALRQLHLDVEPVRPTPGRPSGK